MEVRRGEGSQVTAESSMWQQVQWVTQVCVSVLIINEVQVFSPHISCDLPVTSLLFG